MSADAPLGSHLGGAPALAALPTSQAQHWARGVLDTLPRALLGGQALWLLLLFLRGPASSPLPFLASLEALGMTLCKSGPRRRPRQPGAHPDEQLPDLAPGLWLALCPFWWHSPLLSVRPRG